MISYVLSQLPESATFLPNKAQLLQDRMRSDLPHILGSVLTFGGALASWQVHAQWFLSVTASALAVVVAGLTIRSLLRKERDRKAAEVQSTESEVSS